MTIQPNSIHRLGDPGFPERFRSLVAQEDTADPAVLATVQEIIAAIRRRGDAALSEYSRRFDRHEVPPPLASTRTAASVAIWNYVITAAHGDFGVGGRIAVEDKCQLFLD